MERYLNTVFFGNNSYGIAAAAETYFGKFVHELTFPEAAFLAGLVRAPTSYDPINRPERSRARFAQVIDRLVEDELLTEDEAIEVSETFIIPERVNQIPTRDVERIYFSEQFEICSLTDLTFSATPMKSATQRYTAGPSHPHHARPDLQAAAETARNELPDTTEGFDAALTSIETETGAVRALVGGRVHPATKRSTLLLRQVRPAQASKSLFLPQRFRPAPNPTTSSTGRPCVLPNPETTSNLSSSSEMV